MTDALKEAVERYTRSCEALKEAAREEKEAAREGYLSARANMLALTVAKPGQFAEAREEILRALQEVYRRGKEAALG